jgi:hypothetical protein
MSNAKLGIKNIYDGMDLPTPYRTMPSARLAPLPSRWAFDDAAAVNLGSGQLPA